MRWNEVTWYSKLVAIIFFIGVLPVLTFYIGAQFQKTKDINELIPVEPLTVKLPTKSGGTDPLTLTSTSTLSGPVLIYTEVLSEESSNERSWPTVNIWKKEGSSEPELLATVGKVGEYPHSFSLSPNRKYLSINLEKKIQVLNIETGEIRTIFTPTQQTGGAGVFSPDSKKIAVVDGDLYFSFANRALKSKLYSVDVETGASSLIRQEESLLYDNATIWREDGKIIVSLPVPKGCAQPILKYYNPSDGELYDLPRLEELVANGTRIITSAPSPKAPKGEGGHCSDGTIPDYYTVRDSISQKVFGKVGREGFAVGVIALSPDASQALFKSYTLSSPTEVTYFIQTIAGGSPVEITDPSKVLSEWHADTARAYVAMWDQTGRPTAILIDEEILVRSSKYLSIVAQYYP